MGVRIDLTGFIRDFRIPQEHRTPQIMSMLVPTIKTCARGCFVRLRWLLGVGRWLATTAWSRGKGRQRVLWRSRRRKLSVDSVSARWFVETVSQLTEFWTEYLNRQFLPVVYWTRDTTDLLIHVWCFGVYWTHNVLDYTTYKNVVQIPKQGCTTFCTSDN
jgi:hypothetical protein